MAQIDTYRLMPAPGSSGGSGDGSPTGHSNSSGGDSGRSLFFGRSGPSLSSYQPQLDVDGCLFDIENLFLNAPARGRTCGASSDALLRLQQCDPRDVPATVPVFEQQQQLQQDGHDQAVPEAADFDVGQCWSVHSNGNDDDDKDWRRTFKSYPTRDDLPACLDVDEIFAKLRANSMLPSLPLSSPTPLSSAKSKSGTSNSERRRVTIKRRPGAAASRLTPTLGKSNMYDRSRMSTVTHSSDPTNYCTPGRSRSGGSSGGPPPTEPWGATKTVMDRFMSQPGALSVKCIPDKTTHFAAPTRSEDLFRSTSQQGSVFSDSSNRRNARARNSVGSSSSGSSNNNNSSEDARSCMSNMSRSCSGQVTVATAPAALRNKNHDRTMVEVVPGEFVPLRGSIETWEAVMGGNIIRTRCSCCLLELCCIQDADLIMCPGCRIISPITKSPSSPQAGGGGGLGLGMTLQEARKELERRGLSSAGLR